MPDREESIPLVENATSGKAPNRSSSAKPVMVSTAMQTDSPVASPRTSTVHPIPDVGSSAQESASESNILNTPAPQSLEPISEPLPSLSSLFENPAAKQAKSNIFSALKVRKALEDQIQQSNGSIQPFYAAWTEQGGVMRDGHQQLNDIAQSSFYFPPEINEEERAFLNKRLERDASTEPDGAVSGREQAALYALLNPPPRRTQ